MALGQSLWIQRTHSLNVNSYHPNLCEHDEPQEIGDHSYCKDEELPAIFTPEGGGIHVHHSRHQALQTHKLKISRYIGQVNLNFLSFSL